MGVRREINPHPYSGTSEGICLKMDALKPESPLTFLSGGMVSGLKLARALIFSDTARTWYLRSRKRSGNSLFLPGLVQRVLANTDNSMNVSI